MASLAVFHRSTPPPSPRRRLRRRDVLLRLPPPPHRSRKFTVEFATDCGGDGGGCGNQTRRRSIDVAAVAALMRDVKAADDVEFMVKGLDGGDFLALPIQVFTSVIRVLGREKRLDAAFAVVEYLKRGSSGGAGAGVNQFVYNCLLGAVKNSGEFVRVEGVLADMEAQGVPPNIVTLNTLMSIYVEQGKIDEVFGLYADIQSRGLAPSAATYSTVLSAYKKAVDAFAALSFFAKLRERQERGAMAKGHCEDDWRPEFGKFERLTVRVCYMAMRRSLINGENAAGEVVKVLLAMDDAGVRPDRSDYERLVWACTGEEHYTIAKELYQRIRECDGEISLSVCNHLIWLMGKARKWWAALEIYEDLLDKGPKPNNMSYELIMSHFNVLLNAARRRGIWRWGVRLLNKMQEKGLKPETREWNAVLLACSRSAETSAALEIFRRMIDQGLKPNGISYGALLSALEKGKLYDEALRVWEHMCKVGIKPNLHAYTILVSVYIGKGNPERVDAVLREMVSSKIEATVVTFNAIITGCLRNNMSGAAFEWFHKMKMLNIEPNEITYQMLIEALVQDGKPRLAYEMYMRAYNQGFELPAESYDTVMEACQVYGCLIDPTTLGPRPAKKMEPVIIKKNLT